MTALEITGEGIAVEREVSESTGVTIMETTLENPANGDEPDVTVNLSGEGMEFTRDITESAAVKILDIAVRDGSQTTPNSLSNDGLPEDFFERLSEKQRIMIEILLEADGEWIRGTDIRQKMREEYGLDVGHGGRATAGVIAGLTRKYDEELRRDVIPGRWADETQQHAEFRIGEKYEHEIRARFEE
jgi:hypothetical protein